MEDRTLSRRPIPRSVIIGLSTLTLLAGSAAAVITWLSLAPTSPVSEFPVLEDSGTTAPTSDPSNLDPANGIETTQPPTSQPPATNKTGSPTVAETGQVFWLQDVDGRLSFVGSPLGEISTETSPETSPETGAESEQAQLHHAVEQLLRGPRASQAHFSTIPPETQLLALSVVSDGIHIDLSDAFQTGGGSAGMVGRLGQIIYTATSLDAEAQVWITINGEPLTVLGGEGLEVAQPMTRQLFEQDFPL